MRWSTVIVDASYCSDTQLGAWAAWIKLDGGVHVKAVGGFKDKLPSSTEAELRAAVNAIYIAKRAGADAVLIQSDCTHVVGSTERVGQKAQLPLRLNACGITLERLCMKHVKGHTRGKDPRHWVNNWCDRNAYEKLQELRKNGLIEPLVRITKLGEIDPLVLIDPDV